MLNNKTKNRLTIFVAISILTIIAIVFIFKTLEDNVLYFYSPSEISKTDEINLNNKIRIGGYVKENSIQELNSKDSITFIITDNKNDILVEYKGILPDLFREKQGAVVEGILITKNKIKAARVFAKHDENYMPSSIKKQVEESKYWKKEY